jgi:adenylate cyclase
MSATIERTVLFADLRGSTALYEMMGNTNATAVVTQSVALACRVVNHCGGTVVKTLGDGLMAMFNDSASAIQAADEMHDSLERIATHGHTSSPMSLSVPENPPVKLPALKLQVGLARGEVVEMGGDFFGDAVNVAARLLDHAGDNETLATSMVLDDLAPMTSARFRNLDRMQLRGRAEPVHVYLLEALRPSDLAATAYGDITATPDPEGIRLICTDLSRVFSPQSLPVVLGRSSQATCCIDDSRVSRSHSRIDWHGGTFSLSDLSYNGTYVRFSNDKEIVSLRRSSCTLHGSGVIGLGAPPSDATAPCVNFEVLKFSDTQPRDL